jgi:hypothetical protein
MLDETKRGERRGKESEESQEGDSKRGNKPEKKKEEESSDKDSLRIVGRIFSRGEKD